MKVNLDDPNLTAFALGELSADDHAKMAEAIAGSPEAQSYVAETQQFARLLRAEYEADRQQPAPRVPLVVRMEEERRASWRYQWGSLAAALGDLRGDRGGGLHNDSTRERNALETDRG